MYLPWRLFEERIRTGPFQLEHFPSQFTAPLSSSNLHHLRPADGRRMNPRLLQFIHESRPRIRRELQLRFTSEPNSPRLTDPQFNATMKMLRKQAYSSPKSIKKSRKRSLFRNGENHECKEVKNEEDEQCSICLETFVMVTACNHMFHNHCLVPWLRGDGRCPVCRFKLCEKTEVGRASGNGYGGDDDDEDDLALGLMVVVRVMEGFTWIHLND